MVYKDRQSSLYHLVMHCFKLCINCFMLFIYLRFKELVKEKWRQITIAMCE
jgi:hypothetical protein